MTPAAYEAVRNQIIDAGYAGEIDWAQGLSTPTSAHDFAQEYIWVVLNSGMKNQVARGIADKVYPALEAGQSASTVFRHKAKCAAIDAFWSKRETLYAEFLSLTTDAGRFGLTDPKLLRQRLGCAPSIGKIVRWHLAKNWGIDCAKPDRHLERIAAHYGTDTHALCERLAKESGDRIATVDLVLWRASNLGLINTRQMVQP